MKKYALISTIAFASTFFSANAQEVVNADSTGFKFTDVKVAKSTPVTNQNKSGTCWCFSANTFLKCSLFTNVTTTRLFDTFAPTDKFTSNKAVAILMCLTFGNATE